jgi:uncharacterized iron-regulated membrane protein
VSFWKRWTQQPQDLPFRRALFQIHLWTGIAVGLYIVVICVTGSILVYRNELYEFFSPEPGGPLPAGFRMTAGLLRLHDNLLFGDAGRRLNGVGAMAVLVMSVTGAVIWWPGLGRWRRSLAIERQSGWKQFTWTLHSVLGFWFFAFVVTWGITGIYLAFPDYVSAAFDRIQPRDGLSSDDRFVDRLQFWLAYAHFGRFGGRVPGCGRLSVCDWSGKAIWAAAGVVPPAMFVTGAVMWWNRVIAPARWARRSRRRRVRDTEYGLPPAP